MSESGGLASWLKCDGRRAAWGKRNWKEKAKGCVNTKRYFNKWVGVGNICGEKKGKWYEKQSFWKERKRGVKKSVFGKKKEGLKVDVKEKVEMFFAKRERGEKGKRQTILDNWM